MGYYYELRHENIVDRCRPKRFAISDLDNFISKKVHN